MSDQMYVVAPLPERTAARVVKVLKEWVRTHEGKVYHDMPASPEKQEVGMMLHDLSGAILNLENERTYRKPWAECEPFFYPNRK